MTILDWAMHDIMNTIKAPTWATHLEQMWTRVPNLQILDSSNLSHVSGYATAKLSQGRIGCAPNEPKQAS